MTTLEGVTPYPPEFAARYRALGYWEDRPLGRFFDEVCAQFSERVALVAGEERITYGELASRAERLALHFLHLGLRPRDRLVMQLPKKQKQQLVNLLLEKDITISEQQKQLVRSRIKKYKPRPDKLVPEAEAWDKLTAAVALVLDMR